MTDSRLIIRLCFVAQLALKQGDYPGDHDLNKSQLNTDFIFLLLVSGEIREACLTWKNANIHSLHCSEKLLENELQTVCRSQEQILAKTERENKHLVL